MAQAHAFDFLVLGAGSGGLAAAQRAATYGAKVALFDPGPLGGTCVNRGCVPKKIFWWSGQLARMQVLARRYGFDLPAGELDWKALRDHRDDHIEDIHRSYEKSLAKHGITFVPHAARFASTDTLVLDDGRSFQAPKIVIATGSHPQRLQLPGFDLGLVSDDMFALETQPRHFAAVGGGYIAIEFACLVRALGSQVTLLPRGPLLERFDTELAQALDERMRADGIRIEHDTHVVRADGKPGAVHLHDAKGGGHGPFDQVLWAVGRVPNSAGLGLELLGVRLDQEGHIAVDDQQNTHVAGIYALGDVTGRVPLTPVAVAAGRSLADRLFGHRRNAKVDYAHAPSVVFAEPPLGGVGMTEQAAREAHGDAVRCYTHRFTPLRDAAVKVKGHSLMKLVCVGKDERVIGLHVLGLGADEMLQGYAVALRLGLTRRDLADTVGIHPTSAEEMLHIQ